jgi:hypothetical protein
MLIFGNAQYVELIEARSQSSIHQSVINYFLEKLKYCYAPKYHLEKKNSRAVIKPWKMKRKGGKLSIRTLLLLFKKKS